MFDWFAEAELCEEGRHDWEELDAEYREDESPVSMNPFTGTIRSKVTRSIALNLRCRRCGVRSVREERP